MATDAQHTDMSDFIPLLSDHHASRSVHVITQPIHVLSHRNGRFFGMVAHHTKSSSPGPIPRVRMQLVTALENLALLHDLPDAPQRWLSEYVHHVHDLLRGKRVRSDALISLLVGLTYRDAERTAVMLSGSGAISAAVLTTSVTGVSRSIVVLNAREPESCPILTQAIEGSLGPRDAIFVGTPALMDALHPEDVQRFLARRTREDVLAELHRGLHDTPDDAGGILITGSPLQQPTTAQASMESFLRTADSTERFLTPSLKPRVRALYEQIRATGALLQRKRRRASPRASRSSVILPLAVHGVRLAFQTTNVAARSILAMTVDGARITVLGIIHGTRFVAKLRDRVGEEDKHHNIPWRDRLQPSTLRASLVQGVEMMRSRYDHLPTTSRHLLLASVLFATLFFGSTVALWRRHTTEADIAQYNATIRAIEEQRSIAEARLLFGDRAAARAALQQAMASMATLPRDSRARRERTRLLEEEVSASLDRARLLTRIQEPLRVIDAAGLGWTSGLGDILPIGTDFALISNDLLTFAQVNPRTGSVTRRDLAPTPTVDPGFFIRIRDDRTLLLFDAQARSAAIDRLTGAVTSTTIDAPPQRIHDAAFFRDRLYLLEESGAITRHRRTAGGFTKGASWLDASEAGAGSSVFAVTGPVTVAHDDGNIIQYLNGRRRETDVLVHVDPPLESAPLLAALPESALLYVGDAKSGRIIAVKDDGTLIGQIQSDAFRNLTRIALDPTGQSLYILANNIVYVIAAPR